jgi:hypothetical protein
MEKVVVWRFSMKVYAIKKLQQPTLLYSNDTAIDAPTAKKRFRKMSFFFFKSEIM